MATIENICKNIQSFLKSTRSPAPIIPQILMSCSLMKRPGLSCLESSSRIIASQAEFGAPTADKFPDGTPNMMNKLIKNIVCEVYRAIKEDMNIQVVIPPGSLPLSNGGTNLMGGGSGIAQ
jgi:hypothetical protein